VPSAAAVGDLVTVVVDRGDVLAGGGDADDDGQLRHRVESL